MDERTAYSDWSRRFEQLSCIKLFHPSYGLFYMDFQSLFNFLKFLHLFNQIDQVNLTGQKGRWWPTCHKLYLNK